MEKSMAAIMSKISADSITVIKDEGQDLGIGFTVGFQIVFDILFICSKPAGLLASTKGLFDLSDACWDLCVEALFSSKAATCLHQLLDGGKTLIYHKRN